jgi:hypothetical protein
MPTDWLLYWLSGPLGLVLIALAMAIPFLFWRLLLGKAHAQIGYAPLAAGYACAIAGVAVVVVTSSYFEFSRRVAEGMLPEAVRWATVTGWSTTQAVVALIIVVPLITVIGVPLSAALLKRRRLNYLTIAVAAVAVWLSLVTLLWARPSNEWESTHRLEFLLMLLGDLAPSIVLIALPFLLAIHRVSRGYRLTLDPMRVA